MSTGKTTLFTAEGQSQLLQTFGLSPQSNGGWGFSGIIINDHAALLNREETCVPLVLQVLKSNSRDDFCLVASVVPMWLVFNTGGEPRCVITSLDVKAVADVISTLAITHGFQLTEMKGVFHFYRKS